MNQEENINSFKSKVDALFSDIERWCKDKELITKRKNISITEGNYNTYKIDELEITDDEAEYFASIIPIGASILGANARVDIKGRFDSVILVELDKGGPKITTTVEGDKPKTKNFYRGIDENGWYWIESKVTSKGYKITKDLFLDLLEEVSGYVRS